MLVRDLEPVCSFWTGLRLLCLSDRCKQLEGSGNFVLWKAENDHVVPFLVRSGTLVNPSSGRRFERLGDGECDPLKAEKGGSHLGLLE